MSTFRPTQCQCAVCGTVSNQTILTSTNAFGSPDLDLRPPEMKRSTMHLWAQQCPECGYVAEDITKPAKVSADWLRRTEYVDCIGLNAKSPLARKFYRKYLIAMHTEDDVSAFAGAMFAAWACDDSGEKEAAAALRLLAVEQLEQLMRAEPDEVWFVRRADLLRRAGRFDAVLRDYADCTLKEPMHRQIIDFQLEKARQQDARCYRVSDAVPDEQ